MPAPSPSTNPSRSTSNGRDARSGSSLRCDSVRACTNPATVMPVMQASAPPAMTTSASPARSSRTAQASASAPDAHADTGECTPPGALNSRPTQAAGPLGISIGTVSGETLRSPGPSSRSSWSSRVTAPPMPVPITTASRSGLDLLAGLAQARVRPRLLGRDERDLLAAVQPPGLHPGEHVERGHRAAGRRSSPAGCTGVTHSCAVVVDAA